MLDTKADMVYNVNICTNVPLEKRKKGEKMTERAKNNLRKGVTLFLSVWTVLVGLAFIVQVLRIYALGESPYTVESISVHFSQIAVGVYVWLAAVIAAAVVCTLCPTPIKKLTANVTAQTSLSRLQRLLPAETSAEERKQNRLRLIARCVCAVFCFACVVIMAIYFLGDITLRAESGFLAEHSEAERILRALIWAAAAIGVMVATAYFVESSYKKEVKHVKATIAENAKSGVKPSGRAKKRGILEYVLDKLPFLRSKWTLFGVRVAIFTVAIVFIIVGIDNGGMLAVWGKGVAICKQCIGIG